MTKTSAISRMPALIAWMSSPIPGTSTTVHDVGGARDLDLVLADADRLDDHRVVAGGIHEIDRVRRRPREPAQVAAAAPSSG